MIVASTAAPHGQEPARTTPLAGRHVARVRVFERTPLIPLPADALVRSWLVGDYGAYDGPSLSQAPVFPATLVSPLGVYAVDVSCWASRPPAVVTGPSDTCIRAEGGCAPGIVAQMAPLGAYKLLGPVVSEIGGTMVSLEEIVGTNARRLSEQIQSARTWEERGRLLDAFLLDRATHGPQPSPEVAHAWHLLVRSRGRTPIREIARQVGWSHKHLITKFRQQIGAAPHLAIRLLRLYTVWRHLDDDHSWARIAADCGYADQAHLTREFRQLTGTTPGALITA